MAEGVAAGRLRYTGREDSPLHRLLHHARIEMVAALGTGFPVTPALLLGEDPLPRPFTLRDRILLRAKEMEWIDSSPHGCPSSGVAIAPSHSSPVAAQQPEPPKPPQPLAGTEL